MNIKLFEFLGECCKAIIESGDKRTKVTVFSMLAIVCLESVYLSTQPTQEKIELPATPSPATIPTADDSM